jgi:DNA polymerase elongation subunit (family B)
MSENITNDDVVFQISDWDHYNEITDDDGSELNLFTIRLYGTTEDNKKIYIRVDGYTPYFFVEIPQKWRKTQAEIFINTIKGKVKADHKHGLKEWKIVDRQKFYGFTNYKFFNFIRLVFHNYESFRSYSWALNRKIKNPLLGNRDVLYKQYESNLEPMLRCMHIRNVEATGWVKINSNKYEHFSKEERPSYNEINISTKWTNLFPVDKEVICPLIVASYDIECKSEDGSFPQPSRLCDKVIQIGTTFNYYGNDECFYKHIITLKSCDKIDGADVESYETEQEVLLAWTKIIRKMNPDIVTGYNIFGFDYRYLEVRAKKLGIHTNFSKLGRLRNKECAFIEKDLSSAALGKNILYYYKMDGRVQIDLMKVVMRDHNLSSYKLDNVASNFIQETINSDTHIVGNNTLITTKSTKGLTLDRYVKIFYNDGLSDTSYKEGKKFKILELTNKTILVRGVLEDEALMFDKYKISWCQAKDDVTPQDIFRLQEGTSADRSIVAKYCLQDCILVNKLLEKLQVVSNNVAMSNVCSVPLQYIFMRGQGIKIFSLVAKKCKEKNHVIPVIKKKWVDPKLPVVHDTEEDPEGFEGATVLKPVKGVHYAPIAVLDYASLYPSSMIHRNISHECLVIDSQYGDLPEYDYYDITFYNNDGSPTICKYAKKKNGELGIIPEILNDLLTARKNTRAKIETETDPFKRQVLDGLQLAFKMTANSLYGQTGASTSAIYLRDIAASTTATGREMLNCARIFTEFIFKKIMSSVIKDDYDAYKIRMDLLLDKKIDDLLGDKIVSYLKQNYYKDNDDPKNETHLMKKSDYYYLRVFQERLNPFTDDDFKNDKKGIKTMEDFIKHFYGQLKETVKNMTIDPFCVYGDSVVGDEPVLLQNISTDNIMVKQIDSIINNDEWTEYEMFKHTDTLSNRKDKQQNNTILNINVWNDNGWTRVKRIIRHKCKKKIYRIMTATGMIDVTEDHSLLDKHGNIIKPNDCKIGTELLHTELPSLSNIEYGTGKKVELMKKFIFSQNACINMKSSTSVTITQNKSINPMAIKNIIDLGYTDDFVYDLETENGHFNAGIGNLTVKNTDSIFVDYGIRDINTNKKLTDKHSLKTGIDIGMLCGELINYILPPPQNLEYEKTFWPWISLSKKRYVGNKYDKDPNKFTQKSMGIVLKRRDNAPIVKIVVGGIVKSILNEQNVETGKQKAIEFTHQTLKDIFANKYPLDKFIITKTLKGNSLTKAEQLIEEKKSKEDRTYADRTRIVHAVLADRIAERDPGNKPQSNDRIPYVYKIVEGTPKLQGDRVETPEYLTKHNLPMDYLFYVTNQIMKPTLQFLEHITDDSDKIFSEHIVKEQNIRAGKKPLSSFFTKINGSGDEIEYISDDDLFDNNYKNKIPIIKKDVVKVKKHVPDIGNNISKSTKSQTQGKKPKVKKEMINDKPDLSKRKFTLDL